MPSDIERMQPYACKIVEWCEGEGLTAWEAMLAIGLAQTTGIATVVQQVSEINAKIVQ